MTEVVDEYELIVTKKGEMDQLILKAEIMPETTVAEKTIEHNLMQQLVMKTNLHFDIEFHPYGSLPRPQVKAIRFKIFRDH